MSEYTKILRTALTELVTLHDTRPADYEVRKPLAWQAARDALMRHPTGDTFALHADGCSFGPLPSTATKEEIVSAVKRVLYGDDAFVLPGPGTRAGVVIGECDACGGSGKVFVHSTDCTDCTCCLNSSVPTCRGGWLSCNCCDNPVF